MRSEESRIIGWDLGGAHLKAACLDAKERVIGVAQLPCPLWQGLPHLEQAIGEALLRLPGQSARHAVTMTGELVDLFANRREGVESLVTIFADKVSGNQTSIYAGEAGFVSIKQASALSEQIASANWMATASFLATRLSQALLVDIGSTTTDIVPIRQKVLARGRTDHERLAHEELVYTGVVRTSLMAVVERIPFDGEWIRPMAEHFATMADVYRLTGSLSDDADQMPSADGKGKSVAECARRLARMIGMDVESAPLSAWRHCAGYVAEVQLQRIQAACERVLSRRLLDDNAPIVGAGVGRFVAIEVARRLKLPYLDFATFILGDASTSNWSAHCAPAVAVAALLRIHAQQWTTPAVNS
jgi:probable H4MPT-linked C1 transfer pathway protein